MSTLLPFSLTPSDWPRADALISRRELFEPFDKTQARLRELARPPNSRVRPLLWPGWASLVLATFAETKVARLPGRYPATLESQTRSLPQFLYNRIMQFGTKGFDGLIVPSWVDSIRKKNNLQFTSRVYPDTRSGKSQMAE